MKTVGVICEYNPFHLGHQHQFRKIKEEFGPDCAIVCAMSGNFVQRGAPAVLDKSLRAQAAILCGADLVLELPVTAALSSAGGFAAGGVRLLAPICGSLCFGAETGDRETLLGTARALLSPEFSPLLRKELDTGRSFPAARQAALEQLGVPGQILSRPNDILAVEYCKAILEQHAAMTPFPIPRAGNYHAETPDSENPSATAIRRRMLTAQSWEAFVPAPARAVFSGAPLHSIAAGERAIVSRLRTMTDAEFEALPHGSEGLWRKFMHACREEASLEAIIAATKSKRYTRSRLDRLVMCAFLGITSAQLESDVPYARILAFNGKGRELLRAQKATGRYRNAGQRCDDPCWELERRCGDLYGLFQTDGIGAPGAEEARRVWYQA